MRASKWVPVVAVLAWHAALIAAAKAGDTGSMFRSSAPVVLEPGDLPAFQWFEQTCIEPDPAVARRLWLWSREHRSDLHSLYIGAYLGWMRVVPGVALAPSIADLRAAAQAGEPSAGAVYGLLLANGAGVKADPAQGKRLVDAAAAQPCPFAWVVAASAYQGGNPAFGVNRQLCTTFWRRAAAAGYDEAVGALATDEAYAGHREAMQTTIARLADAGHPFAQVTLSAWYHSGPRDVRNPAKSIAWLAKAVDVMHGHATSWDFELATELDAATPAETMRATSLLEQAYGLGDRVSGLALAARYLGRVEHVPVDTAKAVQILRHLTDDGDQYAAAQLGRLSMLGLGVPFDPQRGRQMLTAAAATGDDNGAAMWLPLATVGPATRPTGPVSPEPTPLAHRTLSAPPARSRDVRAFWEWRRMAREPDADLIDRLAVWSTAPTHDPQTLFIRAVLRLSDRLGPPDVVGAVRDLNEAVDQDYAPAEAKLGCLLLGDDRVLPDVPRAKRLLERAIAQRDADAMGYVAGAEFVGSPGYAKDHAAALDLMLRAAGSGDDYWLLIAAYFQALDGQYDVALATAMPYAKAGSPLAQYMLGEWCAYGTGQARDLHQGFSWFQQAYDSSHGHHAETMFELGRCYAGGLGVAADPAKAIDLFRRAYALGCNPAGAYLAIMYAAGQDLPSDPTRTLAMLTDMSDRGSPFAQRVLAEFTLAGRLVPRDVPAARQLLQRAAWSEDLAREDLRLLDGPAVN